MEKETLIDLMGPQGYGTVRYNVAVEKRTNCFAAFKQQLCKVEKEVSQRD